MYNNIESLWSYINITFKLNAGSDNQLSSASQTLHLRRVRHLICASLYLKAAGVLLEHLQKTVSDGQAEANVQLPQVLHPGDLGKLTPELALALADSEDQMSNRRVLEHLEHLLGVGGMEDLLYVHVKMGKPKYSSSK